MKQLHLPPKPTSGTIHPQLWRELRELRRVTAVDSAVEGNQFVRTLFLQEACPFVSQFALTVDGAAEVLIDSRESKIELHSPLIGRMVLILTGSDSVTCSVSLDDFLIDTSVFDCCQLDSSGQFLWWITCIYTKLYVETLRAITGSDPCSILSVNRMPQPVCWWNN
jgi:hypothetical protein